MRRPNYTPTHPAELAAILKRALWVLLIPLARGLWQAVLGPDKLTGWLEYAWVDISLLLFALTYSFLKWKNRRYLSDGGTIHFSDGFLYRRSIFVKNDDVISTAASRSIPCSCGYGSNAAFNPSM